MEDWRKESKIKSYKEWKRAMDNFAVEVDNHYHKFTVDECSIISQALDIVDSQTKKMEKEIHESFS